MIHLMANDPVNLANGERLIPEVGTMSGTPPQSPFNSRETLFASQQPREFSIVSGVTE